MDKIRNFDEARAALNTDEGADRLGHFHLMDTDLLFKIASGEIDAQAVVKAVLANRGVDQGGKWIGFPKAAQVWEKA